MNASLMSWRRFINTMLTTVTTLGTVPTPTARSTVHVTWAIQEMVPTALVSNGQIYIYL